MLAVQARFLVIFLMNTESRVLAEIHFIIFEKTQSLVLTKFCKNFVSVKMFALRKKLPIIERKFDKNIAYYCK